jgi:hypothetical protein
LVARPSISRPPLTVSGTERSACAPGARDVSCLGRGRRSDRPSAYAVGRKVVHCRLTNVEADERSKDCACSARASI